MSAFFCGQKKCDEWRDLLTALEEIAKRVDPDGTPGLMHESPESLAEEAFHIARAAIARAKGKRP